MWFGNAANLRKIESNNILMEYQSGFRKNGRTTDLKVRLESYVREALFAANMLCRFSSWIRPTIWKYDILRNLKVCVQGQLSDFISKFFNEICFRVPLGLCFSNL